MDASYSVDMSFVPDSMRQVTLAKSMLDQFYQTEKYPALRFGQAVYQFFKLERLSNPADKAWADKLYNASLEEAKKMIEAATDFAN